MLVQFHIKNGTYISSATWSPTGSLLINLQNNPFSQKPMCNVTTGANSSSTLGVGNYYNYNNGTTSSIIIYTTLGGVAANVDLSVMLIGPS